jgi:hypothetical protein
MRSRRGSLIATTTTYGEVEWAVTRSGRGTGHGGGVERRWRTKGRRDTEKRQTGQCAATTLLRQLWCCADCFHVLVAIEDDSESLRRHFELGGSSLDYEGREGREGEYQYPNCSGEGGHRSSKLGRRKQEGVA